MEYGSYILSGGKEAGYLVESVCEKPDCNEKIHRGMAYACGGAPDDMGGYSCEGYFCTKHLYFVDVKQNSDAYIELGEFTCLCAQCVSFLAYLDMIEEAEHYRSDPIFEPNEETSLALKDENSPFID